MLSALRLRQVVRHLSFIVEDIQKQTPLPFFGEGGGDEGAREPKDPTRVVKFERRLARIWDAGWRGKAG